MNDFEKICTISPAGHSPTRRARRDFRSIRSIVPQELVYIKTYPSGMIKQIQQIYRIYSNPHKGLYKCSSFLSIIIWFFILFFRRPQRNLILLLPKCLVMFTYDNE